MKRLYLRLTGILLLLGLTIQASADIRFTPQLDPIEKLTELNIKLHIQQIIGRAPLHIKTFFQRWTQLNIGFILDKGVFIGDELDAETYDVRGDHTYITGTIAHNNIYNKIGGPTEKLMELKDTRSGGKTYTISLKIDNQQVEKRGLHWDLVVDNDKEWTKMQDDGKAVFWCGKGKNPFTVSLKLAQFGDNKLTNEDKTNPHTVYDTEMQLTVQNLLGK